MVITRQTRHHWLFTCGLTLAIWFGVLPGRVLADSQGNREPVSAVRLTVRDAEGQVLKGEMLHFNLEGFTIRLNDSNEDATIPWSSQNAEWAYRVMQRIYSRERAEDWLMAAEILEPLEQGERYSELAIKRAQTLDPDVVAKARNKGGSGESDVQTPGTSGDSAHHEHGPVVVGGDSNMKVWPTLTPEQHQAAIDQLHQETQSALDKVGITTSHTETDFFILYTNLDRNEARRWLGLLDKMYIRLCKVFDIDRKTNIWRGKALIVILREPAQYAKYNAAAFGNPMSGSAGVCVSYGNGHVKISFYRQPDEGEFAHVLVHEAVHGFVHRYIGPGYVPNWANEGLAEFLADDLVPRTGIMDRKRDYSLQMLRRTRHLGAFFLLPNIEGWQYGVAYDLATTMIRENRKGYVKFIQAIKGGKPWQKALEEDYGLSVDQLIRGYGRVLKISDLKAQTPG